MRLGIIVLSFCALTAVADEKQASSECAAAVDAAESMNVNQPDCDYSNEGLNGFLQKAFKKGEEGAVLPTSDKSVAETNVVTQSELAPVKKAIQNKSAVEHFSLQVVVDQWANLPVARAQLLPKALEQCGQGFAVTGEHYRSLGMGKIELELDFQCD